ncbi:Putative uncharacterized protein [Lactobacillus delbrueckii subsp. lactis]|nr:Putative uncharacterized protein [Lactobacillus delbrueckii subsp. lactis]
MQQDLLVPAAEANQHDEQGADEEEVAGGTGW